MLIAIVMQWLAWLIAGAIVGWIANKVMDSHHTGTTNMIVGALGAFMGGIVYDQVGIPRVTDFDLMSVFAALAAAIVLLILFRIAERRWVKITTPEGDTVTT